jgi:hypothetical protein
MEKKRRWSIRRNDMEIKKDALILRRSIRGE